MVDQVKWNLLSGSDWISNWSDDKDGVAEYYPGNKEGHTNPKRQRGARDVSLADASGWYAIA